MLVFRGSKFLEPLPKEWAPLAGRIGEWPAWFVWYQWATRPPAEATATFDGKAIARIEKLSGELADLLSLRGMPAELERHAVDAGPSAASPGTEADRVPVDYIEARRNARLTLGAMPDQLRLLCHSAARARKAYDLSAQCKWDDRRLLLTALAFQFMEMDKPISGGENAAFVSCAREAFACAGVAGDPRNLIRAMLENGEFEGIHDGADAAGGGAAE
jgi:hypothetical protein